MFEKESEELFKKKPLGYEMKPELEIYTDGFKDGYNKANEWHYVKDGDLPRQDGHTCFSIEVLSSNKKWVYYEFSSAKWFCGNKEVTVIAWKEIELPKEIKENEL